MEHPFPAHFAFDHVSLGVESEEDLWELKDKLEAADIWVSEVVDHGFIHSIYSFDPNNIPLEFSYNVRGAEIRLHPVMGDVAPSEITREGSEPQPNHWPTGTGTHARRRTPDLSRSGKRPLFVRARQVASRGKP